MNGNHGQGFRFIVDKVVCPESEREVDWAVIGCGGVAEKVKHYTHFRITSGGGAKLKDILVNHRYEKQSPAHHGICRRRGSDLLHTVFYL